MPTENTDTIYEHGINIAMVRCGACAKHSQRQAGK